MTRDDPRGFWRTRDGRTVEIRAVLKRAKYNWCGFIGTAPLGANDTRHEMHWLDSGRFAECGPHGLDLIERVSTAKAKPAGRKR